jgi:outer membrane protein assembly factor BamD
MSSLKMISKLGVAAGLIGVVFLAGCGGKNKTTAHGADTSQEPDKILFERSMEDLKKGKLAVARFTLQTLINTYPDSEYLAKAKLAIADSFYKEGDTAGLTQAIAEYKDFITFFPYLDEAAYAQERVGLVHFRRMDKPDRDRNEALLAEQELQNFLLKYPQNPNAGEVEQYLRDVQEVLAEGDYRVARFYYLRGSYRAAGSRLIEIVDRYPLYSHADSALWMLANSYETWEKTDAAARYYSRLVRDYPLSPRFEDAKKKLVALGVPVPQPSPEALARMQKEKEFEKQRPGFLRRSLGVIKTGPDMSTAAHVGPPNLNPPGESGNTETLTRGGQVAVVATGVGTSTSSSRSVQTVTAGGGAPGSTDTSTPVQGTSENSTSTDVAPDTKTDGSEELPNHVDPSAKKKGQNSKDKTQESSSKKKKGLRRLIPF